MIKKQITLHAKKDAQDTLKTLLDDLVRSTRTEKGCVLYELYALDGQSSAFMVMAGWKDKKALAAHLESGHFKTFQDNAADLIASQNAISLTHISVETEKDEHPLDMVYDFAYDLSLGIPFAGPTTKKILDKAHMREVGKGFMIGFKPFYPRRTLNFIAENTRKLAKKKH